VQHARRVKRGDVCVEKSWEPLQKPNEKTVGAPSLSERKEKKTIKLNGQKEITLKKKTIVYWGKRGHRGFRNTIVKKKGIGGSTLISQTQ